MMNNFMNGMFGKIGSGMCKLSMSGNIAVKTSNGYKSYNVKSGKLTNCGNFVFPGVDENFFFVIPTNKVAKGDIILVNGRPKCVIEADKTKITVINYEDSTVETILPERHVFMGNTYFYGKIVSMFGSNLGKDKNSANKIFKYMMMTQMMNGAAGTGTGTDSNPMSAMMPFMMMNGGMGDVFDGMFDFGMDDTDTEDRYCWDHRVVPNLYMPYIPDARMDRVKHENELFTLKYFAQTINSLHFGKVEVLDPHSDVSAALFNKVHVESPNRMIEDAVKKIASNNLMMFYPDGAYGRFCYLY